MYNNTFGGSFGPGQHGFYWYMNDPNTGLPVYHFSCTQAGANGCTNWVNGCMDTQATNYDPNANCDDPGTCIPALFGCTDKLALNYAGTITGLVEDGSCLYMGCDDPTQMSYGYIYNANHPTHGGDGSLGLDEYVHESTYSYSVVIPQNIGTGINNGGPYYGQTFTYSVAPPSPGLSLIHI